MESNQLMSSLPIILHQKKRYQTFALLCIFLVGAIGFIDALTPGNYTFINNVVAIGTLFVVAIYYGVLLQSSMYDSNQTSYLLSLPVKKSALWWGFYKAGLSMVIKTAIVNVFILYLSTVLSTIQGVVEYPFLSTILAMLFVGWVCYTISFSIACVVTSKKSYLISVFFIMIFPIWILYCLSTVGNFFVVGTLTHASWDLYYAISPFMYLLGVVSKELQTISLGWLHFFISIGFLFMGATSFSARFQETSDRATSTSSILHSSLKALFVVGVSATSMIGFSKLALFKDYSSNTTFKYFIVAGIVSLFCMIVVERLSKSKNFLVTGICYVVVGGIFVGGAMNHYKMSSQQSVFQVTNSTIDNSVTFDNGHTTQGIGCDDLLVIKDGIEKQQEMFLHQPDSNSITIRLLQRVNGMGQEVSIDYYLTPHNYKQFIEDNIDLFTRTISVEDLQDTAYIIETEKQDYAISKDVLESILIMDQSEILKEVLINFDDSKNMWIPGVYGSMYVSDEIEEVLDTNNYADYVVLHQMVDEFIEEDTKVSTTLKQDLAYENNLDLNYLVKTKPLYGEDGIWGTQIILFGLEEGKLVVLQAKEVE